MLACRVAVILSCALAAGCGGSEAEETPAPAQEYTSIVPEPSPASLAAPPPCPFAAANWRARAAHLEGGGDRLDVELSGEVRATGPASPLLEARPGPTPPLLIFDLRPGDFPAEAGTARVDATVSPYNVAFTAAAIHCAGREIARVPIRVEG